MTARDAKPSLTAWSLWRRNGGIWAALMLLLAASLTFAYIPMGLLTSVVGIVIAVIKASLVVLLFMELFRSKTLVHLAALSGIVFLAALFALTLADVLTRLRSG